MGLKKGNIWRGSLVTRRVGSLCPSHLCLWIAFLFLLLKKQQHLQYKKIIFFTQVVLVWNAKIFSLTKLHHQLSLLLLDICKFFLSLLLKQSSWIMIQPPSLRFVMAKLHCQHLQRCESGANDSKIQTPAYRMCSWSTAVLARCRRLQWKLGVMQLTILLTPCSTLKGVRRTELY